MLQSFTDQLGRTMLVDLPLRKIVSVVPSQTELLYHLGLEKEIAGITKFCIHPEKWFREKTRVGGTKQLHLDKIKELRPGLILANKEENDRTQIEELAASFPVWISDICRLEDATAMVEAVGSMTSKEDIAASLIRRINEGFALLKTQRKKRIAYFIWKDPYMAAGGNTFINDMIERAGFENVLKDKLRYPEVDLQEIEKLNCDYLFLSSEPYPFREKHFAAFLQTVPNAKPVLVNGEMFSWYGSRLIMAADYFRKLNKQLA